MTNQEVVFEFDDALRERIVANLGGHDRRAVDDAERKQAAVAVVVTDSDNGPAFLICRRAARLNRHSFQWALPGGRLDAGETAIDAARRELHEELGIDLPADAVLGLLDDYPTRSGYVISPVVLWGGGALELSPAPDEVHAVYRVGFDELCQPDSPRFVTIPESDQPVVQIPILGTLVHAPTAAILVQFRWLALEGNSESVAHFEQPVFAWK